MLAKYTQVKEVDFTGCEKITGEFRAEKFPELFIDLFGIFLTNQLCAVLCAVKLPPIRTHHTYEQATSRFSRAARA